MHFKSIKGQWGFIWTDLMLGWICVGVGGKLNFTDWVGEVKLSEQ
jgi:hypothetical protein